MSEDSTTTAPAATQAPSDGETVFTATAEELRQDAPPAAPISEEQAMSDKGAIDNAFSKADPIKPPDFKEPGTEQAELLPVENLKRKITRMTLELPVHFTDEQQIEEGDKLANMLGQVEEIEDEKAKAMKEFKEEIDGLYVQIQAQAKVVKAKGREQQVECEEVIDYVGGIVITRRLDTMEEVKRRPMERHELQQEMALVHRQEAKKFNVIDGHNVIPGPWNNPAYGQNSKPGDTLLDSGVEPDTLCKALLDLEGVEEVQIFENATDQEDEEKRPPKCVEIMINGGDGMAIAKKIVELLPIKVRLYGNTTVNVERENDFTVQVLFSRPIEVAGGDPQALELKPEMAAAAESAEGAAVPAGEDAAPAAPDAQEGREAESDRNDAHEAIEAAENLEHEREAPGSADGEDGSF